MSGFYDRLCQVFAAGHRAEVTGLLDDGTHALGRVRPAAVLIAVTDRPEPGVILTHRPKSMRDHAGQIAFPGGKIDAGETAVQAALREAEEELSIPPDAVRIIGECDCFVSATGFRITPVLGLVRPDLPIVPHPKEVDDWFEAPLAHLVDAANERTGTMRFRGAERTFLEINWEGRRIWGVTAAILHNLSRRLAAGSRGKSE